MARTKEVTAQSVQTDFESLDLLDQVTVIKGISTVMEEKAKRNAEEQKLLSSVLPVKVIGA